MLCLHFNQNVVNLLKEHKRYVGFFSGMSDPCGSRHNTKSWISDPSGSLALFPRQIYDSSGSVGKR